jgi:hypothetical protein
MELLKRKILLEDSIDRTTNSTNWGSLTADTFYINVFLTQNIDDMGLFTDIDYISANTTTQNPVDYSILINKLNASGLTFSFMTGGTPNTLSGLTSFDEKILRLTTKKESDYYNYGNSAITGNTDSKIDDVKSYDNNDRYKVGFDMEKITYFNYNNVGINGVSRVISNAEPKIYAIDANNDANIGTNNQNTGIVYTDYSSNTTTFRYIGEGINETNTSLSAITKEEYLFGIISKPEVINDVFIDRGLVSVMESHLRLSEINDLGMLTRYNNGFYKLNRQ